MSQKELRTLTYLAAGKQNIEMLNLPPGRATHVALEFEATVSNTSGGNVTIEPSEVIALMADVNMESTLFHCRSDGPALHALYHAMHGKAVDPDTGVVIANGASGTVRGFVYVPMADPRADDPNYGAQDTRLLNGKNLDLRFSSMTVITGATITTISIYPVVHVTEGAGLALPAEVRIDYDDMNQKTSNLPDGSYANLLGLHQTAGTVLTPTLIGRVRMVGGSGETVLDGIRLSALIQDFNDKFGAGNAATSEYLSPQSAAFAPILTAPSKYKLSQLPQSNGKPRIDMQEGTLTALRYVYRMVVPTSKDTENEAWRLLGVVNPERMATEAKTLSKTPLVGSDARTRYLGRILPKRPSAIRRAG